MINTDADYVEAELRKALDATGGPRRGAENGEPLTVRVKAEGAYRDSRWLTLTVPEFEALITATVAKVAEREGN
jgi:hypothetical protein